MNEDSEKADLLYGVPAIAAHMGIRPRQAWHQIDKAGLPTFKSGGVVCSRRSSIAKWLADQEAATLAARKGRTEVE